MPGEGLRGPSPTCRLCQVGCQGGRGRDTAAALLPPGCGSAAQPSLPCAVPGKALAGDRVLSQGLGAVGVTPGSGVCDISPGPGSHGPFLPSQTVPGGSVGTPLFQLCQALCPSC